MRHGRSKNLAVQREFTFINHTKDAAFQSRQKDDMPTVRSHAMREVRRRKRVALGATSSPDAQMQLSTLATDHHPDHTSMLQPRHGNSDFERIFAGAYAGTALELHDLPVGMFQHLQYFVHGFTPSTFPITYIRHRCDILDIALNEGNLALLHAICAVGACHLALTHGKLSSLQSGDYTEIVHTFLRHKQYAVVLLRRHLLQYVTLGDHSSLAIVTLLLMLESLSGDCTTAEAHKAGLLELTRCFHGTPHASALLIPDVLMSDLKTAGSRLSKPLIDLDTKWSSDFEDLKYISFMPHRPDLIMLGSGFLGPEMQQSLGSDFVSLMCAMRNLINATEHNFDAGITASGVYGAHVLALEHQLLSVNADTSKSNLQGCCRIAALLYCNLCIWTWPKNATLMRNLLAHFRTAVSRLDLGSATHQQYPLLYWLNFVGSFAAPSMTERTWFLEGMNGMSDLLDIMNESSSRSVLAKFFYVDRLMGQHMKECFATRSANLGEPEHPLVTRLLDT